MSFTWDCWEYSLWGQGLSLSVYLALHLSVILLVSGSRCLHCLLLLLSSAIVSLPHFINQSPWCILHLPLFHFCLFLPFLSLPLSTSFSVLSSSISSFLLVSSFQLLPVHFQFCLFLSVPATPVAICLLFLSPCPLCFFWGGEGEI